MRKGLIILLLFCPIFGVRVVLANNTVVLNEIMANPTDNTEWVELFNPTDQIIDLSSWKIKDGNSISSDDLTLNGYINPSSFMIFDHNKGWLNDSGTETVSLLDKNSQTIDSYQYSGTTKGKTFSRQPNGGDWIAAVDPTKGESNDPSTPAPQLTPEPTFIPTPLPTPTPQPAPSSTPTNTPVGLKTKTTTTTSKNPVPSPNPATPISSVATIAFTNLPAKSLVKIKYQVASIAGVSSSAALTAATNSAVEIKGQKQSYFVWIGMTLIFAGFFSIGYIYLKSNAKILNKF